VELLKFLEPNHHGQQLRLEAVQKALKKPAGIVEERPFLQAVNAATDARFAAGGPAFSAVIPFLDSTQFRQLLTAEQAARTRFGKLIPLKPVDVRDWKPCIEAFAEVVAAHDRIIGLFRELQQKVLISLDAPEKSAEEIQLTVPEIAKYILGSEIHAASRASNERLVRKWIQTGRLTARKLKRGLYSIAVAHLEILKDVNH